MTRWACSAGNAPHAPTILHPISHSILRLLLYAPPSPSPLCLCTVKSSRIKHTYLPATGQPSLARRNMHRTLGLPQIACSSV